ncbi:hypothetical protein LUZ62_063677 [Rhynchospora pubera]|uniref:Nitrate regulatory gene2 protein-like n=1 Tax=Rhynchospora pubera TaxID=906938 RepID=A0AAV8EDB1_9POAL|nr:hypothetical protein LUZ62_063677 [Rhynchospora pubera]
MGCAQSRIENEEAVARCKERRQLMKSAVVSRNAFAAAHSAYAVSLKDTGAALSEFAQGESTHPLPSSPSRSSTSGAAVVPPPPISVAAMASVRPPIDNLPPPPPPLPEFSPSPAKMQRSISMPEIPPNKLPHPKPPIPHSASIQEEVEEEEEEEEVEEMNDTHLDDRRRRNHHHLRRAEKPPLAPVTQQTKPPPSPPRIHEEWDYFFAMDARMSGASLGGGEEIGPDRDEDELEEEDDKFTRSPPPPPTPPEEPRTPEPPPPPPQADPLPPLPPKPPGRKGGPTIHHQHAVSAPPLDVRRGKMVASENSGANLLQILAELDEHFLKASESAQEVSKMLEANRMHYHSNFADNRGQIDHSARVMKIITWNRSFKGLHNGEDVKDGLDNDELETLATVLDKMLAWEKKLFDEVKAGELMKIEYQRKVALLNKQKKNGASIEALEKTKAAVSHLHTRYIVDMQSLDCTVSEIQHLRDNQLYPKLVALADGMSKMWGEMYKHHEGQLKSVLDLKSIDVANSPIETTEHHHGRTSQLCRIVEEWHSHFSDLVTHQKEYIQSLNSWLKLNLIPIESSLKEKVSSPPRPQQPPIQALLYAWNENLGRLPDDLAKSAINSFLAVLSTIKTLQQDEIKQKEKYLETRKEYDRKCRSFEDWYQRYAHKNVPAETDPSEGVTAQKDPVAERRFLVESLKSRLDDELEAHNKLARQVREKSLASLKTHLPELFRSLSDFSRACSDMHGNLRLMSRMQNGG